MGMFIICLLGGWFGLHKFIEKKTGLGVLYLFSFGLFGIGWIIDCIKYLLPLLKSASVPYVPAQAESPYIFLKFTVVGVTFKNGRKTRQAILRAFKWEDEIIESVDFERYLYENKDAVYVKINDQVIGNIPADTVQAFLNHESKYKRDNIHCNIYGGNKLDDGSSTSYGCEITIRYIKERA